jgi:hypothetical protein
MSTETRRIITSEEYSALTQPVPPPSPKDLFDYQVETLVKKGLASYSDADGLCKNLPSGLFLFVPPTPPTLDLAHLMSLVELDGKRGVNYLNAEYLKNLIETPKCAYLLTGVEDGRARLNTKPSVSRQNIRNEKRTEYTTFRGIIHCILFPSVLKHHYMDLSGSRYRSAHVPSLCLYDGKPALNGRWDDGANPEWGAPSASEVVLGV